MRDEDFSQSVSRYLKEFGWPSFEVVDREYYTNVAARNNHKLFDEWFDYVALFKGINFVIEHKKFSQIYDYELTCLKLLDDPIDALIGVNTQTIMSDSEDFAWLLAEDGTIYSVWSGMVFYEAPNLNKALLNIMDGIEGTEIGNVPL